MTRRAAASAAVGVAVTVWVAWAALTTPARRLALSANIPEPFPVVRGAYHVHSLESDGTGSIAEIGRAASRAGLDFVILTDHGDGARSVRPPRYYSGVLCVEEVEISATEGHYAAIGLPKSPYPLGGDARGVAEDVARLGGFGIAAHPDSAKVDLQWREWSVPLQGIEWFNGDSQWRDEQRWRLPPTLIRYLRRPAESVASLFDRPDAVLARWDALSQQRPIVGLAGHDAHQRLGLQSGAEPAGQRLYLKLPSYEDVFRAFTTSVELDSPLIKDARVDARAVVDAIRAGRVYTAIDAVATPARFVFEVRVGDTVARMGDSVPLTGPIAIKVRSDAPAGSAVVLMRNGEPVDTRTGGSLEWFGDRPGVYRVEINIPSAPGNPPIPWIVSNPVYIGVHHAAVPAPVAVVADPWPAVEWATEKDSSSRGSATMLTAEGETGVAVDFELGADRGGSPFVAAVTPDVSRLRHANRLSFRVWADRPMRASLQIRSRSGNPDDRWRRSFYADSTSRIVSFPLAELAPVRPSMALRIAPDEMGHLMFVMDTTNTRPGTRGRLVVDQVRSGR